MWRHSPNDIDTEIQTIMQRTLKVNTVGGLCLAEDSKGISNAGKMALAASLPYDKQDGVVKYKRCNLDVLLDK